MTISSLKSSEQRRTDEVISLIRTMSECIVRVVILNQSPDIYQGNTLSKIIIRLVGELERNLVRLRTKEALDAKNADLLVFAVNSAKAQRVARHKSVQSLREIFDVILIFKPMGFRIC